MNPDELVVELSFRYTHATGGELELIHASIGFKEMVRKWTNEMWPNMIYAWPNLANDWIWKKGYLDMICGVYIKYDINSPEVILLAKTE